MEIKQAFEMGVIAEPRHRPGSAPEAIQQALDALANRAAIRDQPNGERSAPRAAEILQAWTGRKWTVIDVWQVQMAVKMARYSQGAYHEDDLVDLIGYTGLLAEEHHRLGQ